MQTSWPPRNAPYVSLEPGLPPCPGHRGRREVRGQWGGGGGGREGWEREGGGGGGGGWGGGVKEEGERGEREERVKEGGQEVMCREGQKGRCIVLKNLIQD